MKSFKDKMYNYEVTPPPESWQMIATALDEVSNSNMQPVKKINKAFYLSLAAAVTIIIFSLFIWLNNSDKRVNETVVKSTKINSDIAAGKNDKETEPDNKVALPKVNKDDGDFAIQTDKHPDNNKLNNTELTADIKRYITISGPQGQPVKISAKVASLIVSSDDQNPPNPVWNAKVNKWKDIMKANALSPTTANFLDIVELTHVLKLNNP